MLYRSIRLLLNYMRGEEFFRSFYYKRAWEEGRGIFLAIPYSVHICNFKKFHKELVHDMLKCILQDHN